MKSVKSSKIISPHHDVAGEASAWIAQIESGNFRKRDARAFREWIERSPRHALEITRHARIWDELNILTELQEPLDAEIKKANMLARDAGFVWRRLTQVAAAGVFLVVCITAVVLFMARRDEIQNPSFLASTAIGEMKAVNLPDGSVVTINTDSQLEIDYSWRERRIRILNGEALFDVAHDSKRPFVVYAGMQSVKAIGTSFSVRLSEADVRVMVSKGRVEVAQYKNVGQQGGERPSAEVTANPVAVLIKGQAAVLAGGPVGPIESLGTDEVNRRLSWRRGELVFAGETLGTVVEEITRYSQTEFVFDDPALKQLPVGGVFKIGDTDALYEVLKESFGVEVQPQGGGSVLLKRGQTEQAG